MARKKTKKKRRVQLGRWKKSPRRRGVFIRRALSMTLAPNPKIARRAGLDLSDLVSKADKRDEIRPPELAKAILGERISESLKKRAKRQTRKKIGYYTTEKEKWDVIKNHNELIEKIANIWWRSPYVKGAFGRKRKDFLRAVKLFVLEQLDYFDPERKDKKGRPVKISDWIRGGVKMICRRIYFDEKKASEKQAPFLEIAAGRTEPLVPRSRVPLTARHLLLKLGLSISVVSEMGFGDIRKQIIKISNETETGLSQREKTVVRMRLEDKTLVDIAKKLGLRSKGLISGYESSAAKNIKKRLEKL